MARLFAVSLVLVGLDSSTRSMAVEQGGCEFVAQSDRIDASAADGTSQKVTVKNCIGTETICVAPQDEVWIVSADQTTNGCCHSTIFQTEQLVCSEWRNDELSSLAICHQQDPEHMTVIVVHGNNTDREWAITRGMQFYDRIFGQEQCNRLPIRLVILAWDSEKVLPRPGPDYRIKSARAVALGKDVGSLLNELGGCHPVLIGYSLGVQVVLSTVTELSNGCEPDANWQQNGFHLATIAPALETDFACRRLASISCNPLIEEVEIFSNRNDRVLRAARLLNRKQCDDKNVDPSLIGLAESGGLDCRFHVNDVTREVRNRNSLVNYIESSTVQSKIRDLVARAALERNNSHAR